MPVTFLLCIKVANFVLILYLGVSLLQPVLVALIGSIGFILGKIILGNIPQKDHMMRVQFLRMQGIYASSYHSLSNPFVM